MEQVYYISRQASTSSYILWIVLMLCTAFVIYAFYRQQIHYIKSSHLNATKLETLQEELAIKITTQQNQTQLFLSEMATIQKSFNSFSNRNNLTFNQLQLNQVVKICSNSMDIYKRVWSQL